MSIAACRAEGQYPSVCRIIKVDPGDAEPSKLLVAIAWLSEVGCDKLRQLLSHRRESGLTERINSCLNCETLTASWLL